MTDKSKRRAREFATKNGFSHQSAVNQVRSGVRRIVNLAERRAEVQLGKRASDHGARVCVKPRMADVLAIEGSGISHEAYSYALKAHFDLVLASEQGDPFFAVEIDGPGHDPRRDQIKNDLCERLGLPLARVRSEQLSLDARGLECLGWLAEVFFANRSLESARAEALLPETEEFDPFDIAYDPRFETAFPLRLSLGSLHRIREAWLAGRVLSPIPFGICVLGSDGSATSVYALAVAPQRCLLASESAYVRGFGITDVDVADELASISLARSLDAYLAGEAIAINRDAVRAHVESRPPDIRG